MIIEIEYFSNNNYLKEFIDALAKEINITISTKLKNYKLLIWVDKKSKNLELFLKAIENNLPYSIFMGKVEVRDGEFFENQERALLPNSISLCPKCIKEILDPNSRRYFYPFTFCRSCGFTSSFLISYPFNRENSLFFPFNICDDCKKEQEENPFRANFPLISCTKCSIPIKLQKKNSQKIFWAWDKKEYKEIFYICAQAILDNKNLLIKTFNGYKLFSKTPSREFDIFITNSNKISSYFLLLEEEKKALFSIEKPKVRATLSNLDLQKKVGSIKYLKAPDCGISILFAKALQDSGIDYIYFKEVDNIDNISYDLKLDFDLPISKYEDIVYSINKKDKFIAKGDRVILPKLLDINKDEVLDKPYVALKYQNSILIDKIEKFNIDKEKKFRVFPKEYRDIFATISVLKENNSLEDEAVGIYFAPLYSSILVAKDKNISRVFIFDKYNDILREIESLREGSNKLIKNFEKKFPDIYKELEKNSKKFVDIFYFASLILGSKDSFEFLDKLSLDFGGKGGVAIDCRVSKDGNFDYAAFYASIMSYKIADAPLSLIAYSIMESLGEFLGSMVNDIKKEFKFKNVAISGKYFSNISLFSRFNRHMIANRLLYNREFAIDDNNIIFGELFG